MTSSFNIKDKGTENLYAPVDYFLALPSKKIRPKLCVATAKSIDRHLKIESSVFENTLELFHNFTLMHDDIMDGADLRRGAQTVHKKYTTAQAILSGDILLIQAYQSLSKLEDSKQLSLALKWFNYTATLVCEGQQLDMDFEQKKQVLTQDYLHMITLKTGVLLGLSMVFGGMCTLAYTEDLQALFDLGTRMGLYFQVQDDYLDLYGESHKTGKTIGGDILCSKKTLLYLKALDNTSNKEDLIALYHSNSDQKVERVKDVFNTLNVQASILKDMTTKKQEIIDQIHSTTLFKDKDPLLAFFQNVSNRQG